MILITKLDRAKAKRDRRVLRNMTSPGSFSTAATDTQHAAYLIAITARKERVAARDAEVKTWYAAAWDKITSKILARQPL